MDERRDEPGKRPRLNLTTSQVAASALAACCASIVASYLGVAGTVIGAAVGSVVATTGAAVYAQLFHRSGARIRQTLLVNGRLPEDDQADADAGAARPQAAPTGRFYGPRSDETAQADTRLVAPGGSTTAKFWLPASSTAEQTRVALDRPTVIGGAAHGDEPTLLAADPARPRPVGMQDPVHAVHPGRIRRGGAAAAIRRYRKPIEVVASIIAVFCVSISVGFLLGGPVRTAGSNQPPRVNTNTYTPATHGAGGGRGARTNPSTPTSPTPSASASATTGATPSPSSADGAPTGTPSTSQPAGGGATGTATGTGNATDTAGAGAATATGPGPGLAPTATRH